MFVCFVLSVSFVNITTSVPGETLWGIRGSGKHQCDLEIGYDEKQNNLKVNNKWMDLGIAFVRYRFRSNAEFAIEAMDHQSMDNEECLNLR